MNTPRLYDEEFKKDALYLLQSSDKPRKHVAEDLGIPESTLRGWERKYKQVHSSSSDSEEIKKLKKELAETKMERDILKKAMGVFSRDQ